MKKHSSTKGKGWYKESKRHADARRGIKSAQKVPKTITITFEAEKGKFNPSKDWFDSAIFDKLEKQKKGSFAEASKTLTEARLKVMEKRTKKDSDGDGVPDDKDCEPYNPKAQDTAQQILRKEYGNSKNFITPNKIKVGKLKENIAFELSSGRGFEEGTMIYGVSVVLLDKKGDTHRDIGLSQSFDSKAEAERYIKKLKNDKTLFTIGSTHFYQKPDGEPISGFLNKIYKSNASMGESELTPYPISKGESVVEVETIIEGTKIIPADKLLSIDMADNIRFGANRNKKLRN